MKFLCVICAEKVMEQMPVADAEQHFREYAEFTEGIKKSGHFIGANRLKPSATATTIRVRNGKVSITDGPFVETKEQFGGYYLIEAKSLDEAINIAAKIPGAQRGCVEIREVAEDPQTLALGLNTPRTRDDGPKNKVVLFEIPAADFSRAKTFYEGVFDWNVELWGDQGAMALTTASDNEYNPVEPGGINGGFYKRTSKDEHASFGVETGSIDRTLKAIEKAGGKVVTPKHAIGEWGFMADFADPEGNVIALWERPKQ